jgi:hypothetical protein
MPTCANRRTSDTIKQFFSFFCCANHSHSEALFSAR